MVKKCALLIGVSDYSDPKFARLNAPAADVAALAAVLENPEIAGFDSVVPLVEPSLEQATTGLVNLFADKERDDLVLFYFSGHGIRPTNDELFLTLGKTRFDWPLGSSIAAASLKQYMDSCASQRQILILDCCYAGAFMGPHRGPVSVPVLTESTFEVRGYGREILTATNESGLAFEGEEVRNDDGTIRQLGKFTHFLVEGLRTGAGLSGKDEITVADLFEYARRELTAKDPSMRPQHWRERGEEPLVIARNPRALARRLPAGLMAALDDRDDDIRRRNAVIWLGDVIGRGDPRLREAALAELERRERDERRSEVRLCMRRVLWRSGAAVAGQPAGRRFRDPDRPAGHVFRDVDAPWCPEMVVVPAGSFMMGSPEGETGREPSEGPQHRVTIARPFAIGRYTVTFDEWDAFTDATGYRQWDRPGDWGWGRGRRPVVNVSWNDAQAYIRWLAKMTGKPYQLPSEAQWEYAARGGKTTPFWTGETISTAQANYNGGQTYYKGRKGKYRQQTVPVNDSKFSANPFGLYHVHGNVWEWVEDDFFETYDDAPLDGSAWLRSNWLYRVLRGGAWYSNPEELRAAKRDWNPTVVQGKYCGFRISRILCP